MLLWMYICVYVYMHAYIDIIVYITNMYIYECLSCLHAKYTCIFGLHGLGVGLCGVLYEMQTRTDFFRHRPFRPCLHVLFDAWMLLLKNMVSLMLTKWPKGCIMMLLLLL